MNRLIRSANRYLKEDDNITDIDSDGVDDKIQIFYSNLDNDTQKKVMEALKKSLNVAENDAFSITKIEEELSKIPLVVTLGDELARKLQIKI